MKLLKLILGFINTGKLCYCILYLCVETHRYLVTMGIPEMNLDHAEIVKLFLNCKLRLHFCFLFFTFLFFPGLGVSENAGGCFTATVK